MKRAHEECQCQDCGKLFPSAISLLRHVQNIHTPDHLKPFLCPNCPKGFATSQKLEEHIDFHSGIKKHICEPCGQKFGNSSNLRAHIRSIHMGVKRKKGERKGPMGRPAWNEEDRLSYKEKEDCGISS